MLIIAENGRIVKLQGAKLFTENGGFNIDDKFTGMLYADRVIPLSDNIEKSVKEIAKLLPKSSNDLLHDHVRRLIKILSSEKTES